MSLKIKELFHENTEFHPVKYMVKKPTEQRAGRNYKTSSVNLLKASLQKAE